MYTIQHVHKMFRIYSTTSRILADRAFQRAGKVR